jgi:DNA-directed RNA polymerase specialized sigma24 family protein
VADDLSQEFALRLVRGDFQHADPGRGRFRDFLRTALSHLVADHRRRQARRPGPLPAEVAEPADRAEPLEDADRQFHALWRLELIKGAWRALEQFEQHSGQPLYTVLRLRADEPELSAEQMAERLAARLGAAPMAAWVHKRLHRARRQFTDLIVAGVAQTLEGPTAEALEDELRDLGLLERCRPALERRRGRPRDG